MLDVRLSLSSLRGRTPLLIAVALIAPLLALVAEPAQATVALRDYLLLPVPSASQMVPVPGTSRIVVASWEGDITIVDRATGAMTAVAGTEGAGRLTWSSTGDRLIGFPRAGNSIIEMDPATDTVRRWTVSGCPVAAASVAGRIFYADGSGSCDQPQHTTLKWLDPVTGESTAVDQADLAWDLKHPNGPTLLAQPGTNHLVVDENGTSDEDIWVIDVRSDGSLAVAASRQVFSGYHPIFLTDERDALVVGQRLLGLPSLEVLDDYLGGTTDLTQVSAGVITGVSAADYGEVLRRSDGSVLNRFDSPLSNPPDPRFIDAKVIGDTLYVLENSPTDSLGTSPREARLYSMPGAEVPAPEVTITSSSGGPFYWGEPVLLRGTVTQEGTPVAGATVDLTQVYPKPSVPHGSVVTDVNGAWSFEFTPPTADFYDLRAGHLSEGRESVAHLYIDVVKKPSTIVYVEEPEAQPGATVVFTGRLSGGGVPLPERVVRWDLQCSGSFSIYPTVLSTTTAADGTFSVTHTPRAGEVCASYVLIAWWDGDARYRATKNHVERPVAWHRSDLRLVLPSSAYVEDQVTGTLALTIDGVAAPDKAVHIIVRRPDYTISAEFDAVTGTDGTVPISVDPTIPGDWTVEASRANTADTIGDTATATVTAARVQTALTLVDVTPSVVVGGSVSVRGRIERADGRNGGAEVQLVAVDANGPRRDLFATSSADGTVDFVDVPSVAGTSSYHLLYGGDNRYLSADQKFTEVDVAKHSPSVTLHTDRVAYRAGQTATLRVNVSGSETRHVVVKVHSATGTSVLFDGVVPAAGLVLTRTLWRNQTFEVTHPVDARHAGDQVVIERLVRLGLATTALRPLRRAGVYAVYRTSADPVFLIKTAPIRPNVCIRMRLQKYTGSAWRTVRTSACMMSDKFGRARWTLRGAQPPGTRIRVRAVFGGDAVNAASVGPWTYVRFVR